MKYNTFFKRTKEEGESEHKEKAGKERKVREGKTHKKEHCPDLLP